jgi:molybdopterin/thiamine biosynthesis adenylyltransferase
LLTLVRLGIGAFRIADFDVFDVANFNRQAGAGMSTVGRAKVDVLAEMAKDINPEVEIDVFPGGIDAANLDDFLRGVDLYIDGLDFFAFEAREATFTACARLGIPACTVAPIGMGAALLNFMPGGMTFEEYFGWAGRSDDEKALRFLVGLAPAGLHRPYLVDPSAVSLPEQRGPSTMMACQLCAGVAATEALKILLGRGKVCRAPHGVHYDAFRNKLVHTWRPGGNRHPLQKLVLMVGRRQLRRAQPGAAPA